MSNAGTRFDDARQFPKRGFLEPHAASIRWCEVIVVAVASILISGIARGAGLKRVLVRQRTTGDDQPV